MIHLNQKSTDQTECLGGGATTLGGETAIYQVVERQTQVLVRTPFRLNFIAA